MKAPADSYHGHAAQRIESAALRDLHEAADKTLRRRLGLHCHDSGDAVVSVAANDPSIVINRTSGLGVFTPASRRQVDQVVDTYREAGVARFFIQHHPQARPAELPEWLAAAGLVPRRAWMKFRHELDALPETAGSLQVEPVDTMHTESFGAIIADGFDLAPESAPLLAGLVNRPGWHPFMVRVGDQVGGVATLFVHEGVGWCDWGATRPEFRSRGIQRALLAARLSLARQLGCTAVYTTTGVAVPGDRQHSYNNILRAGFRELYESGNFAPPG